MEFHTSDRFHSDKRKTIMVDIDETISYYEGERSYDLAKPIQENVDLAPWIDTMKVDGEIHPKLVNCST